MGAVEFTIVGLGRMGSSLARALVTADVRVNGFDTAPSARADARQLGVQVFDRLAEAAARSDVVVTSLPTVAAARGVVGELGQSLPAGARVIETSTCAPAFAREAAAELADREVCFVDCPVSGKPPTMTMFVGGPPGALGDAEEVLAAAVGTIVHLGAPGAGYGAKLLQQYVKYARFLVAAEALTFAANQGLDVSETLRALESSTGARPGLATAEEYFRDNAYAIASHAPVATIAKDMELTRAMFRDAGFDSPSFTALAEFFNAANAGEVSDRPYPEAIDLLSSFRFDEGD